MKELNSNQLILASMYYVLWCLGISVIPGLLIGFVVGIWDGDIGLTAGAVASGYLFTELLFRRKNKWY